MDTQVKKWGNSLAIRISQPLAKELHSHSGTEVDMELSYSELIIKVKKDTVT